MAGVALLFLLGAVATRVLLPIVTPLLRPALTRQNFAGEPILAAAGLVPALAVGLVALSAPITPLLAPLIPPSHSLPIALATLIFAALGLIDDLWGRRDVGGLRGHLRRLTRDRQVTTELVKAVGGAAAGLAIGWLIAATNRPTTNDPGVSLVVGRFVALIGAWIALSANAVNLLDLRPLRAMKGTALLALLVVTSAILAGGRPQDLAPLALLAGAMAVYLPWEARRRMMLGDAGANFLGATVATTGALAIPSLLAIALLTALLVALHAWTERHSLSAAITARPWLARLDAWGWQPGIGREKE